MEVVTMKKLFVLAVALLISSAAWAATTNFTATASFAGNATFSFQLKNIKGDGNAQSLTWAEADAFVMGGTTTWVAAQQYAVVAATITKANAYVTMYTNNKTGDNADLAPNYTSWNGSTGVAGTETYGGLVRVGGDGGAYRGYIPVLFSYVPTKGLPTLTVNASGAVTETISNDQSDRYLSDKSNGGYDANYTVIASLNGPTFFTKEGNKDVQYPSTSVQNNTAYMYFFGGFKDIVGGDTYTTTVYVEEMFQ